MKKAVIFGFVFLMFISCVSATDILQDNYTTTDNDFWSPANKAMVFNASDTYTPRKVGAKIYASSETNDTYTWALYNTTAGLTTGSPLCSVIDNTNYTTNTSGEWYYVNLTSCPTLSNGNKYSLAIIDYGKTIIYWRLNNGMGYTRGNADQDSNNDSIWVADTKDLLFEVYEFVGGNLSVSATDFYNSSTINNFSIEIEGYKNFSTTDGRAETDIPINITSPTNYNITIWGTTNYFNRTYNWNNSLLLDAVIYPYTRIYANNTLSNTQLQNISVIYNGANYSGEGYFTYVPIYNETVNITIDVDGYSSETKEVTANLFLQNYTVSLYTTNSVLLNFKDESDNSFFNENITINLDIIGNTLLNVTNRTLNNYSYYIDLLSPDTYKLVYSSSGYGQRDYYFNLENDENYLITLYLLNNTLDEQILYTLNDEDELPVEGVIIQAKKLFIDEGKYNVVGECLTDSDGQCAILQEVDEAHSYTLTKDDQTKNIDPFIHYTPTKTFTFSETGTFELFDNYVNIFYNLSYNNITDNFRLVASSGSGNTYEFCLKLYNLTGIRSRQELITENCINSSSTTILINQDTTNKTIKAVGTVSINPLIPLDVLIVGGELDMVPTFGTFGLLLGVLLILVLAAIGTGQSPATAITMTLLGVIKTYLIGLISVTWGSVVGVIIVGVTIAYYTRT